MRPLIRFFHDAYRDLPAATWLLAAAGFINRAGAMVVPFLQIYLGERFHFSYEQAGWFGSLFGVGALLGSLLGGVLTDRLGPVRLQIVSLTATCIWLWLLALVTTPWLLGGGLFVFGLFHDAFRPGNITAAVESCPPHLRAKALTLNRLALNAGWAIGPAIGGLLSQIDFSLLFLADGLTCGMAALFLFHWRHRLPQTGHRAAVQGRSAWGDGRFLLLAAASTLLMLAFLQSVFTMSRHLHDALGISKAGVGLLLMINPGLIVLCEMPLVHALRHRPQLPVVAVGALLIGGGMALLALPDAGLPIVLASILVVLAGEMLWSPQLGAYMSALAPEGARGRYMGVYAGTISLSMILAPGLGGKVYDDCSPAWLWLGCGGVGTAAALVFLLLHRAQRQPLTAAATVPPTTPAADPRAAPVTGTASAATPPP